MDTDFSQFNPYDELPDNFFLILYGIRRCGKSNALKQLLYDLGDKLQHHKAFLFSGTAKVDPEQYAYFPTEHQYHDMSTLDSDLQEIIDQQMPASKKPIQNNNSSDSDDDNDNENEDNDKKKQSNNSSSNILIVLDDVVNETTVRNSRALNYLAIAGRHLKATVIILSQTIAGSGSVPPIIRTNADAIMMCTLPKASRERDLICEYYLMASARLNKSMCYKIIEQITSQPYRMVVIALYKTHARKITDFVFEYGPVPFPAATPDFKIGTEEQWGSSQKKSENTEKMEKKSKKRKIGTADSHAEPDVHAIHGGSNLFNRGIEAAQRHTHIMGKFSLKLAPDSENANVPISNLLNNTQYTNLNFNETDETFNRDGIPFTRTTVVSSGFLREKPKVLFSNSKKKKISLRRM